MTPDQLVAEQDRGTFVLDLRAPLRFAAEHVPGSINLRFNRADLVERAELVLPKDRAYVVVADADPIAESARALLTEAGYQIAGALDGGIRSWSSAGKTLASLPTISVDEVEGEPGRVVDVREPFEYRHGHVPGATLHPSTQPWDALTTFPEGPLMFICADEVRSAFVASVAAASDRPAVLVLGGMVAWLEAGKPAESGIPGDLTLL